MNVNFAAQGPSTQGNSPQRELRVMAPVEGPKHVADYVLNNCESLLDAIHLCIIIGKYKHNYVAKKLGIDPGHFARMMSGDAHFPTNKMGQLMQVCGNLAPLQWLAKDMNQCVYEDPRAMELAMLERRREQLLAEQGPSIFVNRPSPQLAAA
jgi:hypothetical protein